MAVKNSTIIEHAWLEGSNDFQQRVPNPQIAGYDAAMAALFEPANHDLLNQFSGLLNGMIGTYIDSKRFENPLRELKKPALGNAGNGSFERHVAVKYLQAHTWRVDSQTLLKLEKPEFVEWFYSVKEPRRYEFSWSVFDMHRAFGNGDGYGFNDLLASTIDQQYSSDNYDEMNIMIQQFATADRHLKLYRNHISAMPTDKATGQELLAKIRTDAGIMQFPTMMYNHIDVPVFESPDTIILWVTPETDAYLDVMALADIFHTERAEVNYRKIVIPQFPIPNVACALTSEDFIYCRDAYYGVEPPFYNPENMTYKYYLQHAEMIGVNPAANCVLYTTDEATTTQTITMTPSGLEFSPATYTVPLGGEVQTKLQLKGTVEPTGTRIAVEPDAATYQISASRTGDSGTASVALNTRTRMNDNGVLQVQKSGDLKAGDTITVIATASYVNPSGTTTEYTATATVTVSDAVETSEKNGFVDDNSQLVYTEKPNTAYNAQ